jgi:hypothetical protein
MCPSCCKDGSGRIVDACFDRGKHAPRYADRSEGHPRRVLSVSKGLRPENEPVPRSDGDRLFFESRRSPNSERRTC